MYHKGYNLLGIIYSKKTGRNDPYRGEKSLFLLSGTPIWVVKSGWNSMGKKW
jgi:hypothetical protein